MARDYTNPERYKIWEHRAIEPQYQRLVQQVNTRFRELKKLEGQEGFKSVTKWSMRTLKHEAELYGYLTPSGRISAKIPESQSELFSRIRELQKFLTAPTSTKTGIIDIYQKRADTINERYGTDFTWEDMGKYFESSSAEKNDTKYGSKTALMAIGEIQKQADTLKEQVRQHKAKHIIVEDSQLQKTVDDLLRNKGLTRLGLY